MAPTKIKKPEDRRVKRTKRILRECLFSLLETKNIDNISVKELTDLADVNRSTFYFYYQDIDDMMMQIQNEIFDVFSQTVLSQEGFFVTLEDFTSYCERFFVFCKEYQNICNFIITNDPKNNLTKKIKAALFDNIPDSTKVFDTNNPKHYLTPFALAAIWETVLCWMNDGMVIPPSEMANFVSNVYFYGGRTVLGLEKSEN